MNKIKKILVTGGAGFIGSHLCKFLLEKGYEVICLDNLFTGSKENIKELFNNPKFEFIRHDITYPIHIECDEIYNLACPAAPVHYQFNPIKTIKCNTVGVVNMLELAKEVKAKFLQASTSEVYGNPKEHPQKETYHGNANPIGPRSCYDEGKRVAETLVSDYHRKHKVEIRIARIFNTYGPKVALNDGRVVSNFIIQALKNEPITIYGKGSQIRSFCYVSELIEGLYKLMSHPDHKKPVNLGNPYTTITMIELAKLIKKLTNSNSDFTYKELPEDDPVTRQPDITIAKQLLNWEPQISLEEGLKPTIEYFKRCLNLS